MSNSRRRLTLGLLVAFMVTASQAAPALAAPPANDDIANATVITALPFTADANVIEATAEEGETCAAKTVWYRYTADVTSPLEATLVSVAEPGVSVGVYSGEPGALTPLGCSAADPFGGKQGRIMFDAMAGTTYYIQVSAISIGGVVRLRHATKPFPVVVRQGEFYLRASFSTGTATSTFRYGSATDHPMFGDWDGDGRSTVGVVRGNTWYLRNQNSTGTHDVVFRFGSVGDVPIIGDWNRDGIDTPGVVRGNTWYLRNSNTQGAADQTFRYGRATDVPVPADWRGTGYTEPGVFREGLWYFMTEGIAQPPIRYGTAGDRPIMGDWNGDASETPGVVRGNTWYLRNAVSTGVADLSFSYGSACDNALVLGQSLTRRAC
jgi:hypothetical protein